MHLGIGILGATGYIGVPYRREIRESGADVRIVALCARRRDLLEAAQREDGADLVTDQWQQVVEHPDVNVVLVATPDALHYESVLACAKQGKHLICEKPIGIDAKQAKEMWSVYRDTSMVTFVPFWTRYAPVFARAREIYQSGVIGEVRALVYRWHNPRPDAMPFTWRDDAALSSAGSIADVGSHAYDTIRWLLGQDAVEVMAHADVLSDPKPDIGAVNLEEALQWGTGHSSSEATTHRRGTAWDYASIAFQMENKAAGTLILSHASTFRKGLAPELEIHGSIASIAVDRIGSRITIARPGNAVEVLETVEDAPTINRFANFVFPALLAQSQHGSTAHPTLEDGYRAQLFTDAASRSAKEARKLSLINEL